MVICRLCREDAQIKCTYHLHGCGGDSNVLTKGVAAPQAMVGTKAAQRHGHMTITKIFFLRGSCIIVCRNITKGQHAQK